MVAGWVVDVWLLVLVLGEDGADDCVFWLSGAVGLFDAAETSWLRLLVVLGVVVPVTGTFELEMLLIEFVLLFIQCLATAQTEN